MSIRLRGRRAWPPQSDDLGVHMRSGATTVCVHKDVTHVLRFPRSLWLAVAQGNPEQGRETRQLAGSPRDRLKPQEGASRGGRQRDYSTKHRFKTLIPFNFLIPSCPRKVSTTSHAPRTRQNHRTVKDVRAQGRRITILQEHLTTWKAQQNVK